MDTPEERARDVARDVHVDPDRLDFTFPDPSRNFEILNNFAKLIPNWFGFARALELSDGEIQQIKENKQLTDGMHAQSVLKKWKEKNGVNAKYGRLITACVQMDIMTVAEKMCKLIPADQIDDDDDEEPKQDGNDIDYFQMDTRRAYGTLVKCSVKLNAALSLDPQHLALLLHTAGFISQTLVDEITELNETKKSKGSRLFSAVLNRVKSFPIKFADFIEILRRDRLLYGDVLKEIDRVYISG